MLGYVKMSNDEYEWEVFIMSIPFIIVSVLVAISNIAIIALILAQQKNASAGFGAAMSGMGSSDSYWSSNKSRSIEGQLAKYTKISAILFFVLVLVSNLIK